MRFHFTCELANELLNIDYRRKILSFLKFCIEKSDKTFYEELYGKGNNTNKDFTMAVFFIPQTKIEKNIIRVNSKRFIINFSSSDSYLGIQFYNALCKQKNIWYKLSDENSMRLLEVANEKEMIITERKAVFNTLSPIVIRDHNRETGYDWFYTCDEPTAVDILKRNLLYELEEKFSRDISYDIKQLKVDFIKCRKIIVKCYELNIPCTLGIIALEGEQYLLQYLYQRGLGSKRSMCFGYLELL